MQPPRDERPTPATPSAVVPPPPSLREAFTALPRPQRAAWFALGALVAAVTTVLAVRRPFARRPPPSSELPYELFPFADNSGVCQEYVALATSLRASHDDARAAVRAMLGSLPADVRPENLRVVRALAPGDVWTVAVDTQAGPGDLAHAQAVAAALNALPGATLRFEGVFYSARRLYETARVLCMPRDTAAAP